VTTTHITKEGLLQAIEKSEHLAGWQKASIIRAAELSTHSANCLSLQSEDNPPLPCDCGAGPSAQESKPWKDVEGIPLMTDYALGWNACRQAMYEANAATSVSAQDASPKDGWKLVPVEMTAWMRKFSGINEWRWKAALDAAPLPEPK
jgi:hypothetical protein